MTDLNALAEMLERDTRDAVGDLRHAIAIASQAQPDWRSTWEAALAELMPNELDRQAAQALRGMGDLERAFDGLYDAACGCATDADIVMHYGYPKAERIIKARAARSALKERGWGERRRPRPDGSGLAA